MEFTDDDGNPQFLKQEKWLHANAIHISTPSGSMHSDIIKHVITFVNNKFRKFIDQDASVVPVEWPSQSEWIQVVQIAKMRDCRGCTGP